MSGLRQTIIVTAALLSGGAGGAALVLTNLPDSPPPNGSSQNSEASSQASTESELSLHDGEPRGLDESGALHANASGPSTPTHGAALLPSDEPSAAGDSSNEVNENERGRSAADILAEFEAAYRLFEEARVSAESETPTEDERTSEVVDAGTPEAPPGTQPTTEAQPALETEQETDLERFASQETASSDASEDEPTAGDEQETSESKPVETHVTQVAVVNNIVPVYINTGTESTERASAPPVNTAGATMVNFGMPVGDGAAYYLRMNLNAGRAYAPTLGSSQAPAKSQSAHDRSPWAPIDYTGMHNPWGSYRIP